MLSLQFSQALLHALPVEQCRLHAAALTPLQVVLLQPGFPSH